MEKILKNILKLVKCILLFFGGLVCLSILMTCFDKTSNSTNCYTKSKTEREEILTNLWGPEIAKVIVDDKNKYLYTSFTT